MKYLLLLFFLFSTSALFSQSNLVPNPSFEDTVYCPYGYGQISASYGWNALSGSPDYFNKCTNILPISIPSNVYGYQNAFNGNAYAGIVTYNRGNYFREYIATILHSPLVIGTKYYISAYFSAGNRPFSSCFTNNIGFYLTNNLGPMSAINNCHWKYDSILVDTVNWVRLTGSFIADSAYSVIVIGNFYADTLTQVSNCPSGAPSAFYYVDDVCLSTDSILCGVFSKIDYLKEEEVLFNIDYKDLVIRFIAQKKIKVIIYSITGQIVFNEELLEQNTELNFSTFLRGSYILTIDNRLHYKIIL